MKKRKTKLTKKTTRKVKPKKSIGVELVRLKRNVEQLKTKLPVPLPEPTEGGSQPLPKQNSAELPTWLIYAFAAVSFLVGVYIA